MFIFLVFKCFSYVCIKMCSTLSTVVFINMSIAVHGSLVWWGPEGLPGVEMWGAGGKGAPGDRCSVPVGGKAQPAPTPAHSWPHWLSLEVPWELVGQQVAA